MYAFFYVATLRFLMLSFFSLMLRQCSVYVVVGYRHKKRFIWVRKRANCPDFSSKMSSSVARYMAGKLSWRLLENTLYSATNLPDFSSKVSSFDATNEHVWKLSHCLVENALFTAANLSWLLVKTVRFCLQKHKWKTSQYLLQNTHLLANIYPDFSLKISTFVAAIMT